MFLHAHDQSFHLDVFVIINKFPSNLYNIVSEHYHSLYENKTNERQNQQLAK